MKQLILSVVVIIMTISQAITMSAYNPYALSFSYSEAFDSISGKVGLKLGDEMVLIPRFDDVKILDKGLFMYKENGKWGLSSLFKQLTNPIYEEIEYDSSVHLSVVTENGKKGVIDKSGNIIIPVIYDDISAPLFINIPGVFQCYYIVINNGKKSLFTWYGAELIPDYNDGYLADNDKKESEKIRKNKFKEIIEAEKQFASQPENKIYKDSVTDKITESIRKIDFPTKDGLYIRQNRDGQYYLQKGTFLELLPEGYEYKPIGSYNSKIGDVTYLFGKNGKWGVKTLTGKTLLEPLYDKIYPRNNMFWMVENDGKVGMTTVFGELVVPCEYKTISFDTDVSYVIGNDKKITDYYYNGKDSYPSGEIIATSEKKYYKVLDEIVERLQKRPQHLSLEASALMEAEEEAAATTEGNYGTYYKLNGQLGVITDYGTDLLPIISSSAKDVLERNPYSLVGMARYIITGGGKEIERDSEGIVRDLPALVEYARELGYGESEFVQSLEEEIKSSERFLQNRAKWEAKQREKEEREERVRRINETLGRISNALVGALTTAAQTIGGTQSASPSSTATSSERSTSGSRSLKKDDGNGFDLSTRQAYINDKHTYERYDSMVSAYISGNRHGSEAEKNQWQKAMKALRAKWENRGESFPHSPNEDR